MRRLPVTICVALLATSCTPEDAPTGQVADALHSAQNLERNGQLAGAAAAYTDMLKQPDAPIEAYTRLAAIDRKLGQPQQALAIIREAQTKKPGNPEVLNQLGYALTANGQSEEAVNIFDQFIAMQPDNAMAYNGKAVAFDKAGNHVAAQEIYKKALTLAPESLTIKNNLAMSMILNDQTDDAIAILEPLSHKPEANATVRQNLALAYTIQGDRTHAMDITSHDLTPEQAQENMLFYERYARIKKKPHTSTPAPKVSPENAKQMLKDVFQPDAGKEAPTN